MYRPFVIAVVLLILACGAPKTITAPTAARPTEVPMPTNTPDPTVIRKSVNPYVALYPGDPGTWIYWHHTDEAICYNCRSWKFAHPEADGRSVGICQALSGKGWRYHVVPLGDNDALELHTRCDFGCNQFSRKQLTGRVEPEIEDEP